MPQVVDRDGSDLVFVAEAPERADQVAWLDRAPRAPPGVSVVTFGGMRAMLDRVTSTDVALVAAAAPVFAVAVTFGGQGILDRQRARRAEQQARDAAVAELLAAAIDLLVGVEAVRVGYDLERRWPYYMRIAGAMLGPFFDLTKWKQLRDVRTMRAFMETALTLDREVTNKNRQTALDYSTLVLPRINRLYATLTALTLGPETRIAAAAKDLAAKVGDYTETIGARKRAYEKARQRFEDGVAEFRRVADQRRK